MPGTLTSVIDGEELPDGKPFTYYVLAEFTTGVTSSPSNFAVIPRAYNDAPIAVADSYTVPRNGTLKIAAPAGVLAGNPQPANADTDGDSPLTSLRAINVTGPTNGTLVFSADGSFTYTPAAKYVGPDSFTYKANDGYWSTVPGRACSTGGTTCVVQSPDSNTVTVSITVTK